MYKTFFDNTESVEVTWGSKMEPKKKVNRDRKSNVAGAHPSKIIIFKKIRNAHNRRQNEWCHSSLPSGTPAKQPYKWCHAILHKRKKRTETPQRQRRIRFVVPYPKNWGVPRIRSPIGDFGLQGGRARERSHVESSLH